MNSESRKKTAGRGKTCSAKRTQTSRKRKAGKMKSPKSKRAKSKRRGSGVEGSRVWSNAEWRANHGSRITDHGLRITSAACGLRRALFEPEPQSRRQSSRGTGSESRITNHESRFTDPANIQWPNKAISAQPQGQQRESAGRTFPGSQDGHARWRIIANWVQRHEIRSSFARGEVGGLRLKPRPTTMACEILYPSTLPEPPRCSLNCSNSRLP